MRTLKSRTTNLGPKYPILSQQHFDSVKVAINIDGEDMQVCKLLNFQGFAYLCNVCDSGYVVMATTSSDTQIVVLIVSGRDTCELHYPHAHSS